MNWAQQAYQEIMEKKTQGIPLTVEDYETLCYCEECFAEDARDAEYLGNYDVIY